MKYLFTIVLFITSIAQAREIVLTKDNVLLLDKPVYSETVGPLMQKAKELDSIIKSKDSLYLVLATPGGSIEDGLDNIEMLKGLSHQVDTISIFAASMGFHIVQGLGERLILKTGTLMTHKPRGGFYGEFPGQFDSRYSHYLKRTLHMDEQVVLRTKGKHTLKSYHDLMENEYWCDGQDCIDQGFADEVVSVSCDKSLSGTRTDSESFMFRGHVIRIDYDFSACPVNLGLLAEHIFIDGEKLWETAGNPSTTDSKLSITATPTSGNYGPSINDPFGVNSWNSPYNNSYSSYSGYQSKPNLSIDKEVLFEINQEIQKKITNRTSREVIKN